MSYEVQKNLEQVKLHTAYLKADIGQTVE